MSKIPNINCTFYTQFGKCINKKYSKWFFNKECIYLGNHPHGCICPHEEIYPRPPVPPAPPPKRKINEDVKIFFWKKEEKVYGSECFVVASTPYIEKAIGVFPDSREAIELRDNKNKSIGLKCFNVYSALISIEKKALGE